MSDSGRIIHPSEDYGRRFAEYDADQCFSDVERVELLQAAVEGAVARKKADGGRCIGADVGCGNGLLGLTALSHGADHVYFVDNVEDNLRQVWLHLIANGFEDRATVILADACNPDFNLPEKVDLLMLEILSAGFFYEPQLQIFENIRHDLTLDAEVVPARMQNCVELVNASVEEYGLVFYGPRQTRWHELPGDQSLTDREVYQIIEFKPDVQMPTEVKLGGFALKASKELTKPKLANVLRVAYGVQFGTDVNGVPVYRDRPTTFLLNPENIYLEDPVMIEPGSEVRLDLRYLPGAHPSTAEISVQATSVG